MDAYLEEELYDLVTYCLENKNVQDLILKENRIKEIGKELFISGGVDAMENMHWTIENRIKEEISKDAKPYRFLWNGICEQWNY